MLTLITGGSGSGKSAYAENALVSLGQAKRIYIATMYPYDEESHRRIERHRNMRAGKGFETMERYTDLKNIQIPADSCVLLECMSNLVANEMFLEEGAKENTVQEILAGVAAIEAKVRHLFIVTNEICSDGGSYEEGTRQYQQYLGEINSSLGRRADETVEVVYGIPIKKEKRE